MKKYEILRLSLFLSINPNISNFNYLKRTKIFIIESCMMKWLFMEKNINYMDKEHKL